MSAATPKDHRAVMASRREAPDSLDYFPTPPWATRALCDQVLFAALHGLALFKGERPARLTVWEPACGEGHMARPLGEYFDNVFASDVFDYAWTGQDQVYDFLLPWPGEPQLPHYDWIITNPPFNQAENFLSLALTRATAGVALLIRTQWLHTAGRWQAIFKATPPVLICPFVERVPMLKGRLDKSASTATDYCWICWTIGAPPAWRHGAQAGVRWLAPCRALLERAGDYPVKAATAVPEGALL